MWIFEVLPFRGIAQWLDSTQERWRRDLNPRTVLAVSRFQGECIRPLCHATVEQRSGYERPNLDEDPVPLRDALIRRQLSPIAAICGRDSGPRKLSRTPLA